MLASKGLDFNLDKSIFIVVGNKKFQKEVTDQLEEFPLMLCKERMKQVEQYSYLGETIHGLGVGMSALCTINKRYGVAYRAIFEIKTIIEDIRSNVPGGFMCGLKLWEMGVLPSLLNSAECWMDLPKEGIHKLNKLQETFYSVLLGSPASCPKPGLYWFTGGILPMNRIIEKKLMFTFHVVNLDKESLAYEVLSTQRKFEFPSLWQEVLEYLQELEITVEELEESSKHEFKKRVKEGLKRLV